MKGMISIYLVCKGPLLTAYHALFGLVSGCFGCLAAWFGGDRPGGDLSSVDAAQGVFPDVFFP